MEERSIRVPVHGPAGLLGDFTGGVVEALQAAVRQAVGDGELTLIEVQVRALEPSLADERAITLTAQCLRRGSNIVFARAEVAAANGRVVALATATFARAR